MSRILIIEDDDNMLESLVEVFEREGYSSIGVERGIDAKNILKTEYFDLIVTDLKLGGDIDGIDIIREVKKMSPTTEILLITAHASIDTAIEAIKEGAYDYITKPFRLEKMIHTAERALEKKKITDKILILETELRDKYSFEGIIGKSKKILNVLQLVSKVSKSDTTILITGESGTGKELIGKSIHFNSHRKDKPLVILNCSAIPENLHESELFGHKKGSFTSATFDKIGLVEEAEGGTLILDEVGELSPSAQSKLLRFLQNKEIRRVGETKSRIIDVRVVAMTNKNLKEEVKSKNFRSDLYFRLNVIPIFIPPLKDRSGDIKLLTHHFIKKYSMIRNEPEMKISRRALKLLMDYNWPGNVRELENAIERAATLCESDTIVPSDLPDDIYGEDDESSGKTDRENLSLYDIEKEYIVEVYNKCNGNKSKAAEMLGISRATLLNKLKQYNVI